MGKKEKVAEEDVTVCSMRSLNVNGITPAQMLPLIRILKVPAAACATQCKGLCDTAAAGYSARQAASGGGTHARRELVPGCAAAAEGNAAAAAAGLQLLHGPGVCAPERCAAGAGFEVWGLRFGV